MKSFFISNEIFLLFALLCLTNNNAYIKSLVILPFDYIYNNENNSAKNAKTPKEYFEYFIKGSIFTTINVNNKPLKFHLTLDRYTSYISEKTLLEIAPKSAEIQKNEDLYSLEYIGILRAKYTNTSFTFLSNDSKSICLNNYSFFMVRKLTDDFESVKIRECYAIENEEIGLNVLRGNKKKEVKVEEEEIDPYEIPDDEDDDPTGEKYVYQNNGYLLEENTNIITQLKRQKFISSYAFMVTIDENEKGKIIIGGIPHEYDPHHYSENFFIQLPSKRNSTYGSWDIVFNDIQYNGSSYLSIKSAEITPDFGFILGTEYFLEFLNKYFFSNYSNDCFEGAIDNYIFKYCYENVTKYFKNISFVLSNLYNNYSKLEFDYKDLFVKAPGNNNLYYFQMIFQSGFYNWKLGRPFFKKYPAVFDQDKRMTGFYIEVGEYNNNNNDNSNNNNNSYNDNSSKFPLAWILVIILSIIVIGLIIAFYKVLPYIKRKKKANELDDDYEYYTNSDANINKVD